MADAVTEQSEIDASSSTPVGEILRRTREHYEQSIEDIETALRIRASQIEAIENGRLEELPGRVYAIGFVRSYSEFLGLDADKMVGLFKRQAAGKTTQPELHFPVPAADGQLPAWWITFLSLFVAIVLLVFWLQESGEGRDIVDNIPPVSEVFQAETFQPKFTPPPAPEVTGEEISTQIVVPPPPELEPETLDEPVIEEKPAEGIILNIRQNSWVEIRDLSGKAMISRVLEAGDQYYVPDRPDLNISIGNAGGVEIEVDGVALRPLGKTGRVLRRLPLDAEYLKKNFAIENEQ